MLISTSGWFTRRRSVSPPTYPDAPTTPTFMINLLLMEYNLFCYVIS
jgi:hypothetical protein